MLLSSWICLHWKLHIKVELTTSSSPTHWVRLIRRRLGTTTTREAAILHCNLWLLWNLHQTSGRISIPCWELHLSYWLTLLPLLLGSNNVSCPGNGTRALTELSNASWWLSYFHQKFNASKNNWPSTFIQTSNHHVLAFTQCQNLHASGDKKKCFSNLYRWELCSVALLNVPNGYSFHGILVHLFSLAPVTFLQSLHLVLWPLLSRETLISQNLFRSRIDIHLQIIRWGHVPIITWFTISNHCQLSVPSPPSGFPPWFWG